MGNKSAGLLDRASANMRVEQIDIDGMRAEWICPVDARREQVILHLHGGGYVSGSIEAYRGMGGLLAGCAGVRVLLPAYRLAPEYPYPAALDDALKAYHWLLAQGYKPANIILCGDSAGGGLSLATVLAIRDQHAQLPAGVVCLSPWADLTLKSGTHTSKAKTEAVLNTEVLREWALSYTGAENLSNPLVSPVFADFHGFPPLFIQVGSEEILLDDALQLAEKARAAGVQVEIKVWDGLWHVWLILGKRLPENRQTFVEIGQFVQRQFQKS